MSLDNGLQIYVNERHRAPVVTVQAWIKTGSIHEEAYLGCGISHFLEHMLFHGSRNYPGQKIIDEVHALGGDMNAYTALEHTVYYIEVPAAHTAKAIDILTDMVMNPLFPESKFKDEKNIILRERDMHGDNPSRVMSEKVWHEMFTVHPAKHPIIGYKSKIESVNRDMMLDYHRRRYSPDRTFFIVSGMVDASEVIKALSDRLDSWDQGDLREPFLPEEPNQLSARDATYVFNDPLTRLSMSWHIPSGGHPDVAALDILSGILGQSKSSRLVQNLKIKYNHALSISCFSYTPSFCGIFGINALCVPENAAVLEAELRKELAMIKDFHQDELDREVSQLETEYIRALRSNSCIVKIAGNSILSYGSPSYVNKYIEDLRAVRIEDLERVCAQYLEPEKSTMLRIVPEEFAVIDAASDGIRDISDCANHNLPEMHSYSGGQKLIKYHDPSLPLVEVGLIIPGGAFFESNDQAGVSSLVAAMLTAGTATYPETELLRLLDEHAIELNITAGNNSFAVKFNCHKKKLMLAMDAFSSILAEPVFAEKQFKREKKIAVEKLKSRAASPQGVAEDAILKLLYGNHPYSTSRHGRYDIVENITLEQVKDFYFTRCLRPDMAVFGIAGDFDDAAMSRLETIITSLPWSDSTDYEVAKPHFPEKESVQTFSNPRKQAVVFSAVPGCDNFDAARFPVDILQAAMSGQGANIFKKIREDAGLAYYTGVVTSRGFHKGYISFYAGTHREAANQVVELMNAERLRLAESGLTRAEFDAAQAALAHNRAEQLEDPGAMMMQCCLAEYYGNGFISPFKQDEIFNALTLEQANKTIRELMSYPAPVTVLSLPDPETDDDIIEENALAATVLP
jgi:zinc protease